MTKKANRFLQKLSYGYRLSALALLNTLVALLLLNAILYAAFVVKDYLSWNAIWTKYGHSTISAVYPGLSEPEIDGLLKETWSRTYIYEPFTQFRERPSRGLYVNVDSSGFRITKNQGPWPPESRSLNIFLFGGSTTFGYGVPDHETVASYLQEYLTTRLGRDVRVYNFGRGSYYSTQERILYEELLASGFVPDMAIFIDGLNDFYYDQPMFTSRFREFVANGTASNKDRGFISRTSLVRATEGFRRRLPKWLREGRHSEQLKENAEPNIYSDPKVIDLAIKRYLVNKKLIEAVSKPFGVKPIFVWQPVPMYDYDQQYHPFSEGGYGRASYSQYGYERMADIIEENPLGDNFLWCADIQKNEKRSLYVDTVHYSAGFSNQFAMVMADLLIERYLVEAHSEHSE